MILFVLFLLHTCSLTAAEIDQTRQPNVTFVIVAFRHGFRNPKNFIKNDPVRQLYKWDWEGIAQLTKYGKQQAFGLGTFLRKRYANLLANYYIPGQIKTYTSSSARCQMTLQSVMAALYKPDEQTTFEQGLSWQPIPYEFRDNQLHVIDQYCPTYTKTRQPFLDDNVPAARNWLNSKADLVKYVSANTGYNGSLIGMSDVSDNIMAMIQSNVPLPHWIENSTLVGYKRQKLIKDIIDFSSAHVIICAIDEKCAKSLVGLLVNEIIDLLKNKSQGKLPNQTVQVYSTHIEGVMSVLRLMGSNLHNTPVSSGFIIEYKPDPAAIRVLYHEAAEQDPSVRTSWPMKLSIKSIDRDGYWYTVADFVNKMKKFAYSDWNTYCGLPKCQNK